MMVLNSLISGIRKVWTNRFLVGMMFLFEFISSMLLLFPLYLMLSSSFARNVKTGRFLAGMDFSLLIDFLYQWKSVLPIYLAMFMVVCVLLIVAFIFLSGGFWGILRDQVTKGISGSIMERFFGYAGRYFWGMIKVTILLAFLYFVAFLVFLLFNSIFTAAVGKGNLLEASSLHMISRLTIALLLFCLINMSGHYLRIFLVENDGERFMQVIRKSFRFLLTNLIGVLSLYCLLSIILAGLILAYIGLEEVMDELPEKGIFIFLGFLIQQVFVLFRSFYRLVFYSSQLVFYDVRCRLKINAA